MTERLGVRRRVILYHHVDIRKVDSSRGDIGTEEDGRGERHRRVRGKGVQGFGAHVRRKVAMKTRQMKVAESGEMAKDTVEVVDG